MDYGRIFGPVYQQRPTRGGVFLRSVTTDLEVLTDGLDAVLQRWEGPQRAGDTELYDEFTSVKGVIPRQELSNLGAYDRSHLSLSRRLTLNSAVVYTANINCSTGNVQANSTQSEEDTRFLADYIVRNSSSRPTWVRMRPLLVLLGIVPIVLGYIGVLLTAKLDGWAILLLTSVVGMAVAGGIAWFLKLRQRYGAEDGSIRVRAQSRKETNAERANRAANLRVGFWTAVIVAPVTIVGTLITQFLSEN